MLAAKDLGHGFEVGSQGFELKIGLGRAWRRGKGGFESAQGSGMAGVKREHLTVGLPGALRRRPAGEKQHA